MLIKQPAFISGHL